tara:strand:+ start:216 stop:488 length:273 start_codon:yes stop_codon:yes gene_type:complete
MSDKFVMAWIECLKDMELCMMTADGFNAAFIGVTLERGLPRAVYSYDKCIDVLMKNERMSHEDAIDYMNYNVTGADMGEQTPIFVREEAI